MPYTHPKFVVVEKEEVEDVDTPASPPTKKLKVSEQETCAGSAVTSRLGEVLRAILPVDDLCLVVSEYLSPHHYDVSFFDADAEPGAESPFRFISNFIFTCFGDVTLESLFSAAHQRQHVLTDECPDPGSHHLLLARQHKRGMPLSRYYGFGPAALSLCGLDKGDETDFTRWPVLDRSLSVRQVCDDFNLLVLGAEVVDLSVGIRVRGRSSKPMLKC
jgi:hypothetical protein